MECSRIDRIAVSKAGEFCRVRNEQLAQRENNKFRRIISQIDDETLCSRGRLNVARRLGSDHGTELQIANIIRQFLKRGPREIVSRAKRQVQRIAGNALGNYGSIPWIGYCRNLLS